MRDRIGSSLEQFRASIRPPVIDGEKFVARTQASFDGGNLMFASWKPGSLYLTPTRLLFYQGDNQLFELPLADIKGVAVVTARWVSKKTCEQLELRKETEKGVRKFRLRIEALQKWKRLIEERLKTCEAASAPCREQSQSQDDRQGNGNPGE